MAHERFRAAQADRQLEDAQPIQHTERLGLTTRDLDAEGRARTRALSGVDPTRGLAAAFTAEGMHRCNLRVKFHRADNGLGVAGGGANAHRQGLQRATQHPAGMRIELRADRPAQ